MLGVDAAGVGHVLLAAFVHIHAAHLALESLLDQSVEQGAAVVAEGKALVIVDDEAVRHVHIETLSGRHGLQIVLLEEQFGKIHFFSYLFRKIEVKFLLELM